MVTELGLDQVVRIFSSVPYPEALCKIAAADVLLLFAQSQPEQIPAKLYEYLHANRYILAFTSGASARVIHETGAGRVVTSATDVAAAITEIVSLHRSGGLAQHAVPDDKLRAYQAKHLAAVFAAQLGAICSPQ